MCNHLFAVNVCHGGEREEVNTSELVAELNRTIRIDKLRYVHNPATPDSLGQFMGWFDFCPRCGAPLLPEIQRACDLANKNRLLSPQ